MLVEVVEERYAVRLNLPGQHGRIHAWVPPAWLPTHIFIELETRLLAVVTALIDTPLLGSRASSPASDVGEYYEARVATDPDPTFELAGHIMLEIPDI